MARNRGNSGLQAIRAYLDQVRPTDAQALTDYFTVTLPGLSAAACNGMPPSTVAWRQEFFSIGTSSEARQYEF